MKGMKKPTLHSQAHLQFTRANAETKNCKRACLPDHTDRRNNETVTRAHK